MKNVESCEAFRRALDGEGKPMSFGVANFNDAESAWKAATCHLAISLSRIRVPRLDEATDRWPGGEGRPLEERVERRALVCEVLLEESAEASILQWKASQKLVLRVGSVARRMWKARWWLRTKSLSGSWSERLSAAGRS